MTQNLQNQNGMIMRQLNFNNSIIDRLLTLVEQKQRQNSYLLRHLDNISQEQPTTESMDVLFYFIPGNETRPPERNTVNREYINAETSIHTFENIESPKNKTCPITFEPFTNDQSVTMINFCSHIFTTCELERWFQTNATCPVCRFNIINREYETPPIDTEPRNTFDDINLSNINRSSITNFVENVIDNVVTQVSNRPINTVNNILDRLMDDELLDDIMNRFRNTPR
jgi:hypothetical protein